MQGGDWNDGMDRVGGESAWLGFFLIVVLREFVPLCEESVRRELDAQRIQLQSAMRLPGRASGFCVPGMRTAARWARRIAKCRALT